MAKGDAIAQEFNDGPDEAAFAASGIVDFAALIADAGTGRPVGGTEATMGMRLWFEVTNGRGIIVVWARCRVGVIPATVLR